MFPVISRFYKGVIMSILFGIMLVFNVINPENRAFISQTLENNKKYESLKQESINQRLSMSRLVEYYVVEGVNQKPKNLIKKFMGL